MSETIHQPCDECGVDTVKLLSERDQLRDELEKCYAELEKCQCEVRQFKGFEVVLKEICDIACEPPLTNEGVTDAVRRIKNERDAAKDHAKAWIDYQCFALRENIGPLDGKGCVQNLDVDKAMSVLAHNELLGLRWHLDSETPKGYKRSTQIYIDSEDLQRLRNQPKREELEKCQADCAVMREALKCVSLVEWDEENAYDRWQQMHEHSVDAISTTSGQSIIDRLNKLEAERSEMWRWFERHHVTGDLSLEEKDAMTPKQMADYVYEELQRLLDETRAMLPAMAQTMVYGSLLRKFKKSQADLAEATAALRQCEQLFNYLNNKGGLGLDVHDLIRKVQDEIKSCIGGAE